MGSVFESSYVVAVRGNEIKVMFEVQYNDEMEAEIRRLEAKKRAAEAGHPEWDNACAGCGCRLDDPDRARCDRCC
jgi:hypothetical protein